MPRFQLMPRAWCLYYHTIRYLKPVQIYGRLLFRLRRPRPNLRPAPPLRSPKSKWAIPATRSPSLIGPEEFRLLGRIARLSDVGWDGRSMDKLWRYNQHYFDDLNARDAERRRAWHHALLLRWVRDNPPGSGVGWEPYPTALRIVNWIKWALADGSLPPECLGSLAVQARWLMKKLEFHLLGNHLLAEAKALIFAGLFFSGKEADQWLARGMRIWRDQLPKQVLSDGGHFERSPMYHSIILEDVLDVWNLFQCYLPSIPGWQSEAESWLRTSLRMRRWLVHMCHPDGEISFFNDAAIGIAASPAELHKYAVRLGAPFVEPAGEGIAYLGDSGYLRCSIGKAVAFMDVGPLAPDHLPGHAHADTLSFELSVASSRILVNSGTSCYGRGAERLRQRGTAAHNTVVIDNLDSSEVWSGFRVARRAKPTGLCIQQSQEHTTVTCAHDGYRRLPGQPLHERTWVLSSDALQVHDRIVGGYRNAEARFHWSPDCHVQVEERGRTGKALLSNGVRVIWEIQRGHGRIEQSTYHPRFGESWINRCLVVDLEKGESTVRFAWQ